MGRLRLGLAVDRRHHEENRWVTALTGRLFEGLCRRFDCTFMSSQADYEAHLGDVDAIVSSEPGWAAPRLDLLRTPALRDRLADVPVLVTFSDPHAESWRVSWFLDNAVDRALVYYWGPMLRHFGRLPRDRMIHFPWAVPDEWIAEGPIGLRAQPRIAIFGAGGHEAYATRNWCRGFPFVDSTTHSGCVDKRLGDAEYMAWLATRDAAIAAGSTHPDYRLTVPKYFEIAAAGALLLAQATDDLDRLGFRHGDNCLVFDETSFEAQALDALARPEAFLSLRQAGRELIRSRHALSVRLDELGRHVVEAIERKSSGRRRVLWLGPASGADAAPDGASVPSVATTAPRLEPIAPVGETPTTTGPGMPRAAARRARPLVRFVVDAPDWAHDFKTSQLRRLLAGEFDVETVYQDVVTAADLEDADLLAVYTWWQLRDLIERLGAELERWRGRMLVGVCSHAELSGRHRRPGIETIEAWAAAVFANSVLLRDLALAAFERPVFYTPNGVDCGFFTPGEDGATPAGSLRVGWAGALTTHDDDHRGLSSVLRPAVDSLEGVELVVARREERCRTRAEMLEFYRGLDVYVCASRAEGTPNPCLEAAACGVPLVTTAVGNMPEFLRNGEAGYLVDRDPVSFASRLRVLRDNPELRRRLGANARQAAEGWDWRVQAEGYRTMLRSVLADGDAGTSVTFRSPSQVYAASADRIDRVLDNLRELRDAGPASVGVYASVIGGLSGLNYLEAVDPERIVLFDVNLAALRYARLMLELIRSAETPEHLVERIFCRPLARFVETTGRPRLDARHQQAYLDLPPDEALLSSTLAGLTETGRRSYHDVLEPLIRRRVLDGTRNCRTLLPCWPVGERVPVGGGEPLGEDESGHLVPNINTLFYGAGWLGSTAAYTAVRRRLLEREIRVVPFDLLVQDLRALVPTAGDALLHVSNIDDWAGEAWDPHLRAWQLQALMDQGRLTVVTSHNGIARIDSDPHDRALMGLAPFVFGRVVEVTHTVPWGFHEIERDNRLVDEYLATPCPADTTLLHILVGEGLAPDMLVRAYRKALAESARVLVLEHDAASADWSEAAAEGRRLLDRDGLLALLRDADTAGHGEIVACQPLAGECDERRNVLVVVDTRRAAELAPPVALRRVADAAARS